MTPIERLKELKKAGEEDPDKYPCTVSFRSEAAFEFIRILCHLEDELLALWEAVESERASLVAKNGWCQGAAHDAVRALNAKAKEVLG